MTMTTTMPAVAGTTPWRIDPAHTEVEFSARHLMISNVKGRFPNPSGTVSYDPETPGSLRLDVAIPVAGIDTRNEQRDAHLRSADFFDAEHFPTMTFKGTGVEGDIGEEFRLVGDLTIRGTTRQVALDVTTEGGGGDPWGGERLGFSAVARIKRSDFGLTWNQLLEGGGVTVSDEIKIILNVELVRPKTP